MSIWNAQKKSETKLVIDIASGSTGAALVSVSPNTLPEIFLSSHTSFFIPGIPTTEALQTAILTSLRTTLGNVSGNKLSKIKNLGFSPSINEVIVSFSSPWIVTKLKTWSIKKKQSFTINESTINDILKDEEVSFKKELDLKYGETHEVFHSGVMGVVLNGYEVDPSVSQKTNSADIRFMMTGVEEDLITKIEDEVLKVFGLQNGIIRENFMFAFMKVLSHSFQNIHSALLVNMTIEVTDLVFIKQGVSILSISVPFGPASFAREISREFSIPLTIAYSYASLFSEGVFESEVASRLEKIFFDLENTFKKNLLEACAEVTGDNDFPYTIFITAPHNFEEIARTLFESVFDSHSVVLIGKGNRFTKEIVTNQGETPTNERLSIMASFASIIN